MAPQPPADRLRQKPAPDADRGAAFGDQEGDYGAICATIMGSAQGRWFLDEYARRNRNIDTELVLAAIARIEAAVRGEHGPPSYQSLRADLLDMARAIAQTRAETGADGPEAGPHGKARAAPASSTVLAAAERIQDVAWTMRERGLDPRVCEQIEALAASILSASSLRDPDDHRAGKLAEVLQYLEHRIDALLETCAGMPATEPAPTADVPTAEEAPADIAGHPAAGEDREPELKLSVAADSGAVAEAGQLVEVVDESTRAPAETASPTEPFATEPQAPACESAAVGPIVAEPSLESAMAGNGHDLEAAAMPPAFEVAWQRPGPTPLPAVEFWSAPEPSEPAAAPAAATSSMPQQPQSEPAAAMEAAVLELDPLAVTPVAPHETAAVAPRPQLELDPIAVEPLFPATAIAPTIESGPATPPAIEAPAEPAQAPAAPAPSPAFRPPEVAMVFLVEEAGPEREAEPAAAAPAADDAASQPQSEAPATILRDSQIRANLGALSRTTDATDIAAVAVEPMSFASGQPAPPAPAPPRPPGDQLLALKAMSEEERIALFT